MGNQESKPATVSAEEIENWYAALVAEHVAHDKFDQAAKSPGAEMTANTGAASDSVEILSNRFNATTAQSDETKSGHSNKYQERKTYAEPHVARADSLISKKLLAETIANLTGKEGAMSQALLKVTTCIVDGDEKMRNAINDAVRTFKYRKAFHLAKIVALWVRAHPWETAAIVIPLILLACTPAILGAVGFGAGGVLAGSIAAGAQAGIGSVIAGSGFAILTSAAMGEYRVPLVFGGVWFTGTTLVTGIAAFNQWYGSSADVIGTMADDGLADERMKLFNESDAFGT